MKILLMGNPNVGKSVIFSRLTGSNVIASNYPGTTIEFTKGKLRLYGKEAELIDVPGVYSLEPISKAEEVAVEMLKEGDVIINVVDATHLERNLYLTLQLLESGKPMVVALNMWDEAKHNGISIDIEKLEKLLGIPVVPTVAISGEGIKNLVERIKEAKRGTKKKRSDEERWNEILKIIKEVQTIEHRHHTILERLSDASLSPISGIIIAIGVLFLTFEVIRFIGEGLISYIFDPIFEHYLAVVTKLSNYLGEGILHDILIGELINGEIDFLQSMGLLTTGLYVPFAMVLPYVFSFYLALGFLEDFGYLPRVAVLVDGMLHKLGLHGSAVIPMLLAMGCNVPGALATRILETKRQRFIAATLMSVCIPCMAQLAIITSLVGRFGSKGLSIVFTTLFITWVLLGILLNKILLGESPEIFLEVPPYRMPYYKALLKKLWMRVRGFIKEAIPFVLLGVAIVNLLYTLGIIEIIGDLTSPLIVGLLGLPKQAVGALVIGFLRKDVAVGMLFPLNLSFKQSVVASVVLAMYFPCVATFVVLLRELGVRDLIKASCIMITVAMLVGGLLNFILGIGGIP